MKKSVIARVGIVAAALTLATTSMMSGTLAQFTLSRSITAQALVAKWDPELRLDGVEIVKDETIKLEDYLDNPAVMDVDPSIVGTTESGGDRIVPGMSGTVPVTIDMSGAEVDTEYTVYVVIPTEGEGEAEAPMFDNPDTLQLTCDGNGKSEVFVPTATKQSVAHGYLPGAATIKKSGDNNLDTAKTVSIRWEWPLHAKDESGASLEDGDKMDTDWILAHSDNPKLGFQLIVELKQATGKAGDKWTSSTTPAA